jgi:hypothetical protein
LIAAVIGACVIALAGFLMFLAWSSSLGERLPPSTDELGFDRGFRAFSGGARWLARWLAVVGALLLLIALLGAGVKAVFG